MSVREGSDEPITRSAAVDSGKVEVGEQVRGEVSVFQFPVDTKEFEASYPFNFFAVDGESSVFSVLALPEVHYNFLGFGDVQVLQEH